MTNRAYSVTQNVISEQLKKQRRRIKFLLRTQHRLHGEDVEHVMIIWPTDEPAFVHVKLKDGTKWEVHVHEVTV